MLQDLVKLTLKTKIFIISVLNDMHMQQTTKKKPEKVNSAHFVKLAWNMNIINILILENSNALIADMVITQFINKQQILI